MVATQTFLLALPPGWMKWTMLSSDGGLRLPWLQLRGLGAASGWAASPTPRCPFQGPLREGQSSRVREQGLSHFQALWLFPGAEGLHGLSLDTRVACLVAVRKPVILDHFL